MRSIVARKIGPFMAKQRLRRCLNRIKASSRGDPLNDSPVWGRRSWLLSGVTNLADEYDTFADLEAACTAFMVMVNGRVHRTTRRVPADMLEQERPRLHPVPALPHTITFGDYAEPAIMPRTPLVRFVLPARWRFELDCMSA